MYIFFCRHKVSTPLGKYQGAQLLDRITEMLSFVEESNYLPKWLDQFVFPSAINERFCCFPVSPAFGVASGF